MSEMFFFINDSVCGRGGVLAERRWDCMRITYMTMYGCGVLLRQLPEGTVVG